MHIYIYAYIYTYIHIYVYIFTHIDTLIYTLVLKPHLEPSRTPVVEQFCEDSGFWAMTMFAEKLHRGFWLLSTHLHSIYFKPITLQGFT